MKRILALFLAAVMALAMCACGGGSGKKAPSSDLISADLEKALKSENPHAEIQNTETIKSLSGEDGYDLTLKVTAKTKYASWTYQADMHYTKYDQGWMMDTIHWTSGDYFLVSLPSAEDLSKMSVALERIVNSENFEMQSNDSMQTGAIALSWSQSSRRNLGHGKSISDCTAPCRYDAKSDNWEVVEDEISYKNEQYKPAVDFSGYWVCEGYEEAASRLGTKNSPFTISNFTAEEFDCEIRGQKYHFVFDPDNTYIGHSVYVSNSDGKEICFSFQFGINRTRIQIGRAGEYAIAMTDITAELPPLKD